MVAHEIDAIAVAVVGVELGRIAVGENAEFERLGRAEPGAERGEFVARPAAALARDAVLQRRVAAEEIVVGEFGRLVEDRVRRRAEGIEAGALGFVVRRGALRHRGLPQLVARARAGATPCRAL